MPGPFRFLPFFLCLIAFLPSRGAVPDTIKLEGVTVSVIPFQENRAEATGSLHSMALDNIDQLQVIDPSELMNRVPGVFMASGSYSTNRLTIRGIGSRTPYSSNRIRTYLDEIPLNTGDGVSTLEDIEMAGIGTIDILKGPSSALYGSGLGGVLVLQPYYPDRLGFNVSIASEFGSFGTSRSLLSATYKQNNTAVHAIFSHAASAGYRENSKFGRSNIFLNARYFGDRTRISFIFSLTNLYGQIPSSLNEEDFLENPEKAAGNWLAIEGYEQYIRLLSGLKLQSDLAEKLVNSFVVFAGSKDPYESRPFNILDDRSVSAGVRDYIMWDMGSLKLKAGVEYYYEWYDWKIYETNEGEQGALESQQRENRQYLNGFAFLKWEAAENFIVDAGLNLNVLNYKLETIFRDDSLDNSGSYSYDPVFSPRIGMNYRYRPDHYFFAAAGHGFSAPSLEETLLPEGMVNTELRPESGWNIEIGTRGRLWNKRVNYELAFYTIFLDDLLVTERITEEIFTGKNAGSARNSGLEFLAHVRLTENDAPGSFMSRITTGLTLSDNRFRDFVDEGEDYSGKHLPGIPGTILHVSAFNTIKNFDTRLQYRYTGAQWLTDGNEEAYGGYHLLNFRLSWKKGFTTIPFALEVYGGIKNILDTHYASMLLVNAPAFGSNSPRYYYPGLPRQFFGGFVLSFLSK